MDSSPSQRHRDVPKWKGKNHHLIEEEESAMNITTIGLDIAKTFFKYTVWMQTEKLCCANNLSAAKYCPFSPICYLAGSV
jgi:hypothetical protein